MKATIFIHDDTPDRNGYMVDINGLTWAEKISLRMDFTGQPIGSIELKREGNRIVAELPDGLNLMLVPAIGFKILESAYDGDVLHVKKAEIIEVSLCRANADDRIPALGGPAAVPGE